MAHRDWIANAGKDDIETLNRRAISLDTALTERSSASHRHSRSSHSLVCTYHGISAARWCSRNLRRQEELRHVLGEASRRRLHAAPAALSTWMGAEQLRGMCTSALQHGRSSIRYNAASPEPEPAGHCQRLESLSGKVLRRCCRVLSTNQGGPRITRYQTDH